MGKNTLARAAQVYREMKAKYGPEWIAVFTGINPDTAESIKRKLMLKKIRTWGRESCLPAGRGSEYKKRVDIKAIGAEFFS